MDTHARDSLADWAKRVDALLADTLIAESAPDLATLTDERYPADITKPYDRGA